MPETRSEFCCDYCNQNVAPDSTYCPHCGSPFEGVARCAEHPARPTKGVCVICGKPCCKLCGNFKMRTFLCDEHFPMEILEEMARVFASIDNVQAKYVGRSLEQAGFHPFYFSRRFNPGGGVAPTLPVGTMGGGKIGGMWVLLPFAEVLKGKEFIEGMELTPGLHLKNP